MEYKCNICSKRFKYEFGYNKHMDVEHGPNSRIVASTSTTTNVLSTNQNIVGLSTNSSNISPLKQKGLYLMFSHISYGILGVFTTFDK